MENATTAIPLVSETIIEPKVVLLYALGIMQSLCGYYLPMSAVVLWWALGIGAFLLRRVYLQYLYSTHFFVDFTVAFLFVGITKETNICPAHCYNPVAQDMAAFFFVVATHMFLYGTKPLFAFNTIVVVVAFFVYATTMIISSPASGPWLTLASICVGGVLGISKVLFFEAAIRPIIIVLER
jgi:hypothetical protein